MYILNNGERGFLVAPTFFVEPSPVASRIANVIVKAAMMIKSSTPFSFFKRVTGHNGLLFRRDSHVDSDAVPPT